MITIPPVFNVKQNDNHHQYTNEILDIKMYALTNRAIMNP